MRWNIAGLVASFALIIGSTCMTRSATEPIVQVEPRSVDIALGTVSNASSTDIEFVIKNCGDYPLKIRGNSSACNLQGCVLMNELPNLVACHQSVRIKMQYKSNRSGSFEQGSMLFFENVNDQPGGKTGYALPITVRGISVADGLKDN